MALLPLCFCAYLGGAVNESGTATVGLMAADPSHHTTHGTRSWPSTTTLTLVWPAHVPAVVVLVWCGLSLVGEVVRRGGHEVLGLHGGHPVPHVLLRALQALAQHGQQQQQPPVMALVRSHALCRCASSSGLRLTSS